MAAKITDEMRRALERQPNRPLRVEDDQTKKIYVLVSEDALEGMWDAELRRELQIGFDQADRGEVSEWDVDELLAEAHRRHAEQSS